VLAVENSPFAFLPTVSQDNGRESLGMPSGITPMVKSAGASPA
jgi:hypothetical protein